MTDFIQKTKSTYMLFKKDICKKKTDSLEINGEGKTYQKKATVAIWIQNAVYFNEKNHYSLVITKCKRETYQKDIVQYLELAGT